MTWAWAFVAGLVVAMALSGLGLSFWPRLPFVMLTTGAVLTWRSRCPADCRHPDHGGEP